MVLVFLWPPPSCSVEQPRGRSGRCQLAGALGAAVPDGDSSAPVKAKRASLAGVVRGAASAAPPGIAGQELSWDSVTALLVQLCKGLA